MKLLGYCLFCLLVVRIQSKPQVTKLFPVEESNTTKPLEKFMEKLRATYNLIFHPTNNTNNVEKIPMKDASVSDLEALKLIWAETINTDKYANLKYPNNSFLDQIKSLSVFKNYENSEIKNANLSSLENDSSVKITTTIETNERNVSSDEKGSNATETFPDDEWFNDVQPLEQLELQNDEINKKSEVEIVSVRTTLQTPPRMGHQLAWIAEWLGSLFSLTHNIYAKLSGTPYVEMKICNNDKPIEQ